MKDIALVFYGQPRAIDNDFLQKQWRRVIENTNLSVDVFGHFWSTTSNTKISETYEDFVKETPSKLNLEKCLTDAVDFKKLIIENSDVLDDVCEKNFSHNRFIKRRVDMNNPSSGRATIGQWYSTQEGVKLATSFDDYKIIVRTRWDIIFNANEMLDIVKVLTTDFLNDDDGIKMQQIGTLDMSVVNGQPIVNDWLTVIPRSCFEFFSETLTDDISSVMNAIFSFPELPSSVQENAFYRFLQLNRIDTKKIHLNCKIHRENDDPSKWKWPNFSV